MEQSLETKIKINDWSFQCLDLINNCKYYYNTNKLSNVRDILLEPLIKEYISNQSLLQFENIFRNKLLSKLNDNFDFQFVMTPGYCCGSEKCNQYLTKFDKYSQYNYMDWPQTFEFWFQCIKNNNNKDKIQIILTPQIGKLILTSTNLQEKKNDFHCRLIFLMIIPTKQKSSFHCECIYSIYDCNGTEIDIYKLICNEYKISSQDLIKYPFLYHLKHSTISLNGIGYYMNQWIKFYIDDFNEKNIGSCYFFVLWSLISVLIVCVFNEKELMKKCKQISQESKGISFQFQTNEINYMKMNIIRLLNYDIQRLVLSNLIFDARQSLKYKINSLQLNNLINNKRLINKEARTKQTARQPTGGRCPRKTTSLYKARKSKKKYPYKYYKIKSRNNNNWKISKIYYSKLLSSKLTVSKFCSKLF